MKKSIENQQENQPYKILLYFVYDMEINQTLRLAIIPYCNFHCKYCSNHMEYFSPEQRKLLTDEELLEIIKIIHECGIKKVAFTGGEPLLKKNLAWFCKELKENCGIDRIEITTNGFLLDSFIQDQNSNYVDFFKISFDSFQENVFNSIVGESAYFTVLKNIKTMISLKKNIVLNVVISKDNLDTLENLIFQAENLGVNLSLLDAVCYEDNQEWWKTNYYNFDCLESLFDKKYHRIGGEAKSNDKLKNVWIKKSAGVKFPYYDTGKIYIRLKNSRTTRRDELCLHCNHFCQEGLCMLRLMSNGWITDCQSVDTKNGFRINEFDVIKQKEIIMFLQNRFSKSFKDSSFFE